MEEKLQEAFNLFAKEGKLSKDQIGTVIRALGLNPTQYEVKQLTEKVGETIDVDTFSKIFEDAKKRHKDATEKVKEAFKVLDTGSSGLIDIQELTHILTNIGEKLKEDEVTKILKEADTDQDGKITAEDFLKVLAKF
eukprot:TRINITY_DN31445_c0_g1_i1.p1 TRINITY_DN31445_c0_g1~~TRINITY_DN31445_c0_g1_i1.p1  ORF type:complete len:137 (+),score=27.93 TRINITY_DN31445_c0_g1_i1:45-455(+)